MPHLNAKANAEEERRHRQLELKDAYDAWWHSPEGRTVLMDLMMRFGMFSTGLRDGPELLAHHEGERNVVIYIIETMNIPKDLVLKMYEDERKRTLQWQV